jgi:transposase
MFKPAPALWVDANQEKRLKFLVASGKTPQKIARRARIALLAGAGVPNHAIAAQLGVSRPTVLLWRGRFAQSGVPGLMRDARRPGRQKAIAPEVIQRVVEATQHTTPPGATHWSVRTMAQAQGLSRMTVQRIWKQHGLQPHRVETFKLSRDPHFVEKLRDVVGLYLDPPDRALVLSVDEKSQIQALDRTAPLLPLRPGIPARQTHDYKRHGTTTLFAALSLLDGRVIGECLPRQRSREFIRFLAKIDRETPADLDLHLIVDNSNTHKSPPVKRWLRRQPRIHLHFIPTSSSWLNMVERWFGEITRKRIRRGTFRSVPELVTAITEYLRLYNQAPTRFVWTKAADMILGKIHRCKEALGTPH